MTDKPESLAQGIIADLTDQSLWSLAPGERLWKIYIFRPASGQATRLEHCIYTKQKINGHLAMITFAAHAPAPGRRVRSGVALVSDLLPDALDRIISRIRQDTHTSPDEYREIDLASRGDLTEQMAYLMEHADVFDAS
ncbi:MAG TPA: hypothetical protein VGA61_03260 [Anaerolineae bacterium]